MKRILIVDDDITILQLLSSALEKNYETYEAMGVQEAIKLLQSVEVDAICSDFNMRDDTGLELLEKLQQQNFKIPFMLMSASDDFRLANEVQRRGASFCCKTDFELIAKIKGLVKET